MVGNRVCCVDGHRQDDGDQRQPGEAAPHHEREGKESMAEFYPRRGPIRTLSCFGTAFRLAGTVRDTARTSGPLRGGTTFSVIDGNA
jgi:hypothetical protein